MGKGFTRAIGAALLVALAACPAFAETWPSKPVELVVPYPPGGSTDVTARVIAENLRPLLGQPVLIDDRGGAPATADLLAGQIQSVFAPLVEVLAHVRAGKLRALGITTRKRSPLLPEVPAIGEVLPGYEVALWNGVLVPARTPVEIVGRMNEAIVKVLHQPEVRARLAEQGSEPVGNSPVEFERFIAAETDKWKSLVRISGARVE